MWLPPAIGRFHATSCVLRSIAQSSSVPLLRRGRDVQEDAVAPDDRRRSAVGRQRQLPRDVLRRAPRRRQAGFGAHAVRAIGPRQFGQLSASTCDARQRSDSTDHVPQSLPAAFGILSVQSRGTSCNADRATLTPQRARTSGRRRSRCAWRRRRPARPAGATGTIHDERVPGQAAAAGDDDRRDRRRAAAAMPMTRPTPTSASVLDGDEALQIAAGESRRAEQRQLAPPLEHVARDDRDEAQTSRARGPGRRAPGTSRGTCSRRDGTPRAARAVSCASNPNGSSASSSMPRDRVDAAPASPASTATRNTR